MSFFETRLPSKRIPPLCGTLLVRCWGGYSLEYNHYYSGDNCSFDQDTVGHWKSASRSLSLPRQRLIYVSNRNLVSFPETALLRVIICNVDYFQIQFRRKLLSRCIFYLFAWFDLFQQPQCMAYSLSNFVSAVVSLMCLCHTKIRVFTLGRHGGPIFEMVKLEAQLKIIETWRVHGEKAAFRWVFAVDDWVNSTAHYKCNPFG